MFEGVSQILSPLSRLLPLGEDIASIQDTIIGGTTKLNQTFGQSRQRVFEFSQAIADTIPVVNRLGGTNEDALRLINMVAETTKRNVVASKNEVANLFAAEKLTGVEASKLVESFQNVGLQFSQIGGSLKESIGYTQSIGANTKGVFAEVQKSMESINKFDFKDGVLGLTRMATQAQLLKVDMQKTLSFADSVLSPEKAIETAAAFQRLGVSVGTLTDPFQLMNTALTDPEGLQNSIVEMTKQFTYFDEKANQFKINPQGMLMMRELKDVVGMSADELAKISINAAELDRRLSMISPSFEFENEEDREYIANIAKMGESGKYEITLTDSEGNTEVKELERATNEELKELIKQQKNKKEVDLSTLAQEQLGVLNKIYGAIDAEKAEFFGGVFSSKSFTEALSKSESADNIIKKLLYAADKLNLKTTTADTRKNTEKTIGGVKVLIEDIVKDNGKEAFGKLFGNLEEKTQKLINAIFPGSNINVSDYQKKIEETKQKVSDFDLGKFLQDLKKTFVLPTSWGVNDMDVKTLKLPLNNNQSSVDGGDSQSNPFGIPMSNRSDNTMQQKFKNPVQNKVPIVDGNKKSLTNEDLYKMTTVGVQEMYVKNLNLPLTDSRNSLFTNASMIMNDNKDISSFFASLENLQPTNKKQKENLNLIPTSNFSTTRIFQELEILKENIQTKINKVEFGELPVFKVVFSQDSNFKVPVDAIIEELKKPDVMREFIQKMMPEVKEYQPQKESSSREG